MNGTPRIKVAAINPAKSPTTPPPNAIIGDFLSNPCCIACVYKSSAQAKDFDCSPAKITASFVSSPASFKIACTFSPYNGAIFVSVIKSALRENF